MERLLRKFIGIIKLELVDVINNIDEYIEKSTIAKEEGRISNYNYSENVAVYNNMISGISSVNRMLDTMDVSNFTSLDEFCTCLEGLIKKIFSDRGILDASYHMAMQRVKLIEEYMQKVEALERTMREKAQKRHDELTHL